MFYWFAHNPYTAVRAAIAAKEGRVGVREEICATYMYRANKREDKLATVDEILFFFYQCPRALSFLTIQ